jgi:hypothetical protein
MEAGTIRIVAALLRTAGFLHKRTPIQLQSLIKKR